MGKLWVEQVDALGTERGKPVLARPRLLVGGVVLACAGIIRTAAANLSPAIMHVTTLHKHASHLHKYGMLDLLQLNSLNNFHYFS
jgi:hypothetical protein